MLKRLYASVHFNAYTVTPLSFVYIMIYYDIDIAFIVQNIFQNLRIGKYFLNTLYVWACFKMGRCKATHQPLASGIYRLVPRGYLTMTLYFQGLFSVDQA